MGKTEKGAIWLNSELFSPYEYWQFWRNTDDRDVEKFLNFFTEINQEKIKKLCNEEKNINNLKILLANEATKILHGLKASQEAEKTAKETFESKGIGSNLPVIEVRSLDLKKGINLLDFLSVNKVVSSKSEARRVIDNKGMKINDVLLNNYKKIIKDNDFKEKRLKISLGKKKHYLIKVI